jgi:hypothetical protein
MPGEREMDPQGRQLALVLGAGRLGLGVGALFATRPLLKVLLFGKTDAVGESLGKLAGARDLTLGALTLAARDDASTLRTLTLTAAALDAADAVAFGLAARQPRLRLAGIGGVIAGGGSAIAGAWAWRRLGGS